MFHQRLCRQFDFIFSFQFEKCFRWMIRWSTHKIWCTTRTTTYTRDMSHQHENSIRRPIDWISLLLFLLLLASFDGIQNVNVHCSHFVAYSLIRIFDYLLLLLVVYIEFPFSHMVSICLFYHKRQLTTIELRPLRASPINNKRINYSNVLRIENHQMQCRLFVSTFFIERPSRYQFRCNSF